MDAGLREGEAAADPIEQFARWYGDAVAAKIALPEAMTLATASRDGAPSARMVLLKGVDARGFVFFTNYESQKGRELEANPRAALVFHWPELHRQVRVTGTVARVSPEESDQYFQSRPAGSRLGTIASAQSRVIPDRAALERRYAELAAAYPSDEIPRPAYWGGFRVTPETIEFWQGRANRLHDRLRYGRRLASAWVIERLAP